MSDSSTRLYSAFRLPPGLETGALGFTWRGPDAHLAPERATPLSQALLGKTNCALVVLTAANLLWSARRLGSLTDTSPCVFMAETLLCWQSDPLYYDPDGPKQFSPPMPVPREIAQTLCRKAAAIFFISPGRHISDPPIQIAENVTSLTRLVLGEEFASPYRQWLTAAIAKLDLLAPNPMQDFGGRYDFPSDDAYQEFKRINMGSPLPLQAVDPEAEADSARLSEHYAEFLAHVDFNANPYLRSPSDLRAAGFVGEPYQ